MFLKPISGGYLSYVRGDEMGWVFTQIKFYSKSDFLNECAFNDVLPESKPKANLRWNILILYIKILRIKNYHLRFPGRIQSLLHFQLRKS